jgi:hypothetical protein
MAVAEEIEKLRQHPPKDEAFREQLERARKSRDQLAHQDGTPPAVKGVDRSGELIPLPRPTILRTVEGPEPLHEPKRAGAQPSRDVSARQRVSRDFVIRKCPQRAVSRLLPNAAIWETGHRKTCAKYLI